MPNSNADSARVARGDDTFQINLDLALVVGMSPVNLVVVSRIAERAGLKVATETPARAAAVLATRRPGTVILDGGADDRDCDGVLVHLAAQRLASGGRMPFVVLLASASQRPPARGGTIDAVVAKPITPERLQPLIQSMIDRVRDNPAS